MSYTFLPHGNVHRRKARRTKGRRAFFPSSGTDNAPKSGVRTRCIAVLLPALRVPTGAPRTNSDPGKVEGCAFRSNYWYHVFPAPDVDLESMRWGAEMSEPAIGSLQQEGAAALDLMVRALELLDNCDGAMDVGAHLDLAICRLRDAIQNAGPEASCGPPGEMWS